METNDRRIDAVRLELVNRAGSVNAFGDIETTIAFYRLAIAKKIFTMELNGLMFTVSHRRYLRIVRRLERLGLGIDRFIRS